jgi:hypothetical protein
MVSLAERCENRGKNESRIGVGATRPFLAPPLPAIIAWLLWGMLSDILRDQKAEPIKMRVVSSCIVFAFTLAAGAAPTCGAEKPETSHLAFVTEYVRELAAIEHIRAAAEQELKQGKESEAFSNAIHTSTLMQLELRSQIDMLKGMRLSPRSTNSFQILRDSISTRSDCIKE